MPSLPKPEKKPKPGVLIRKLDTLVSKIVIARDKWCVTCGTRDNLTCSHWIGRAHKGVRWSLTNCNCACMTCNQAHSNRAWDEGVSPYTTWMVRHYGQPILQDLIDRKDELIKISDIERIYSDLRILAKNMNLSV